MGKNITIPNLEDIEIKKNGKSYFATINLQGMSYEKGNVLLLIDKLKRLNDAGFTTFDTSYNTGYYDSIEDISLEFIKTEKK